MANESKSYLRQTKEVRHCVKYKSQSSREKTTQTFCYYGDVNGDSGQGVWQRHGCPVPPNHHRHEGK